jgi:glycosyltransferase involved in cell wall biosynthesis
MRIVQAMAGAKQGGAEAFFERLAIALERAGTEQKLILRRDAERTLRLREAKIQNIKELSFGGFFDFTTRPQFRQAIKEFHPSVVLTWMNRATRFCPGGEFVHAARLGGYYNLNYYKHCDHLIGNTKGIVQFLNKSGWPKNKTHYLPNFVSVEKLFPQPRAALNTPENVPLILALGRLHKNKGFHVLIDAMTRLPTTHLWLAGEGPERKVLELLVLKLGLKDRVHFLGWRRDIGALFAAVDMFVCSSLHEPLGNMVIEAWAAHKPVVAVKSQGPLELIRDGETGVLVPPNDADALAQSIERVCGNRDLMNSLSANGYATYLAEFTEAIVVDHYREFFSKVGR